MVALIVGAILMAIDSLTVLLIGSRDQ